MFSLQGLWAASVFTERTAGICEGVEVEAYVGKTDCKTTEDEKMTLCQIIELRLKQIKSRLWGDVKMAVEREVSFEMKESLSPNDLDTYRELLLVEEIKYRKQLYIQKECWEEFLVLANQERVGIIK